MADVETKFKAALNVVENLPKTGSYKPSPQMMLSFYAYYKQATIGHCNRAKPWSFDVINKAKWDAWNALGNMTKEQAMENYVKDLSKIIEVLPASDKAADFVQTLGSFYEIVDPKSEQANHLKTYIKSKANGDTRRLSNGDIRTTNGIHSSPITGPSDVSEQTTNGFHPEQESSDNDDEQPLDDITDANQNAMMQSQIPNSSLNESDDEFCDTSADMTHIKYRQSGSSESPSSSTSTSLSGSPNGNHSFTASNKRVVDVTPHRQMPVSHGGQHGTHGINEPVQAKADSSDNYSGREVGSNDANLDESTSRFVMSQAGGNGEDRNPSGGRPSEVQERIAVALLQLQRDMHSVLNRLTTLETITISRQQDMQHCHHCCMHRNASKDTSWRLFGDLGPRTTLFIILWPFISRLLILMWRKSRYSRR